MIRRARMPASAVCVGLLALNLLASAAFAQTYEILRSFNTSDGELPTAGLIQGTDGNLYGTTDTGGTSGFGTIFKIDTTGSTFVTLHSFVHSDGSDPEATLIQAADGNLYGATIFGGSGVCSDGCGTIFKIDTSGSTFTTLHSFTGGSDGAGPVGGLIQGTDGNLYGTTAGGGANGFGTIFKIDTAGSALTTLHSFADTNAQPYAGLIQGMDGNLYGTTNYGPNGFEGYGTIFRIDPSGASFTTLHSFDIEADGAYPYGGVIQGRDGNLYGTTYYGIANPMGTIFKIDPDGTMLTTLYEFNLIPDGSNPWARLIQGTDGTLYGTTLDGGAICYCGTIFKIDTSGSTFTTLHSFAGSDGALSYGGVIQASDGNLYGTALAGGANEVGVVFRFGFSPRDPLQVSPSGRPTPRVVVRP